MDRFFHLLIFRFDFVSFSVRFWCRFGLPNGAPGGPLSYANRPLGRDGLGMVLVRSFFLLEVGLRFCIPLGLLLGSSWVASDLVLGHLGVSWARFGSSWAFRMTCWGSYNLIFASTHRRIIPSTYGSSALDNPARRTARSDKICQPGVSDLPAKCPIHMPNLKILKP